MDQSLPFGGDCGDHLGRDDVCCDDAGEDGVDANVLFLCDCQLNSPIQVHRLLTIFSTRDVARTKLYT